MVALLAEFQKLESRRVPDKEIAARLKITPCTISKWRSGKTQLEQVEWLLQMLEQLPEEAWIREIKAVSVSKNK